MMLLGIVVVSAIILAAIYFGRENLETKPTPPEDHVARALKEEVIEEEAADTYIATSSVDPYTPGDFYLSGADLARVDTSTLGVRFETTMVRTFTNPQTKDDREFASSRACRGAARGRRGHKQARIDGTMEPLTELDSKFTDLEPGQFAVPNIITREDPRGYIYKEQVYDIYSELP